VCAGGTLRDTAVHGITATLPRTTSTRRSDNFSRYRSNTVHRPNRRRHMLLPEAATDLKPTPGTLPPSGECNRAGFGCVRPTRGPAQRWQSQRKSNSSAIDVINVFLRFFYSCQFFYVFPRFLLFFNVFMFKKRCQMQSMNMQKSNEKYS